MKILMVAAENGALPGGKVGGIGDVLRDVPKALAALGHQVTVLIPSYGRYAQLGNAKTASDIAVSFMGDLHAVHLYSLPAAAGVQHQVLDHPIFAACGTGKIYCDDPPERPFATDATKFSLFAAAVADGLRSGVIETPDVLHLHDWHTATIAVLLRTAPAYAALASLPLVFTIHNLALQGIRPLTDDESSLKRWFPSLRVHGCITDPRYANCYNPVRAAILLCDRIHAVSPTYAKEICDPQGKCGEGLQKDLIAASKAGRLHGILNGCEYPQALPEVLEFSDFLSLARAELKRWIASGDAVRSVHLLALSRIDEWMRAGFSPVSRLTLISRFTDQKMGLLARGQADGRSTLAHALDLLNEGECLLALGSGQRDMERLFGELQADDPRLLFLCGYSDPLSEQLYASGDLFLMPSRFEPCGIAQMLAMRSGQPCLVNRTGGLADTVEDTVTGYVFEGCDDGERSAALLRRLRQAMTQLRRHPRKANAMRSAAAAARFPWDIIARRYVDTLYTLSD